MAIPVDLFLLFMRHVLGGITRPALQRIESHHAQGMVVLTRKEVADRSPESVLSSSVSRHAAPLL
jgi:hypothetical protein